MKRFNLDFQRKQTNKQIHTINLIKVDQRTNNK